MYKEFSFIVCLTIGTLILTINIKVTIVRQTIKLNPFSLYKRKVFRKIYMLMEFSSSGENTSYQGYGLLLLLNMAAVRNMQPSDRELKQQMAWSP